MGEERERRVIQNQSGMSVAVMHVRKGALDGQCEWRDGRGAVIAFGLFQNGRPVAGTFLNWTRLKTEAVYAKPYDVTLHCRDWVSLYEAGYDSEVPDYLSLIEVYCCGRQICEKQSQRGDRK